MIDQDYIRRGVELANGFTVDPELVDMFFGAGTVFTDIKDGNVWFLDALAAQLVRQVDALANEDIGPVFCSEFGGCSIIWGGDDDDWHGGDCKAGPANNDRTMNTIRAIVDSEVLE